VFVKREEPPQLSPEAALFNILFNYMGLEITNVHADVVDGG